VAELNQQQVVDYIKGISVLELSQLVKALESGARRQRGGGDADGHAGVAPAAGGAAAAEEKTEFTVILTDIGGHKINVDQVVPRSDQPRPRRKPRSCRAGAEAGSRRA
jgi:large subunit ribosomal protein L7/L12